MSQIISQILKRYLEGKIGIARSWPLCLKTLFGCPHKVPVVENVNQFLITLISLKLNSVFLIFTWRDRVDDWFEFVSKQTSKSESEIYLQRMQLQNILFMIGALTFLVGLKERGRVKVKIKRESFFCNNCWPVRQLNVNVCFTFFCNQPKNKRTNERKDKKRRLGYRCVGKGQRASNCVYF